MQDPKEEGGSEAVSREKRMFLLSLGSLIVGAVGYFSLNRDLWIFYVFAHLGALGMMGLLGSAAGVLARRRRRGYWMAFSLGSMLPITLGVVAVLIFLFKGGHLYCGGSVSLGVAVLVVVSYLLAREKAPLQMENAGQ